MESKAIVVIPTYNEAENIAPFIARVLDSARASILVVDDASPDGTAAIVRGLQASYPHIHLLERSGKQGLATAYIAGFGWALERGFETIVQMDADFSHNPIYLPKMLAALENADVVTGTRYAPGGSTEGWGWLRTVISRGGNFYARTALGAKHSDLTGGFNLWRANVLKKIQYQTIRSRGYAFQVELKYRTMCCGFRIQEFPIHFENRRLGKSKMSGSIVWEAAFRVAALRGGFQCPN